MIRVYKTTKGIYAEQEGRYHLLKCADWDELMAADHLYQKLESGELFSSAPVDAQAFGEMTLLAPIGSQEVWAAGVTYLRSKTARMEESRESGAASFYDKVYNAERPELFFKSPGQRVRGPGDPVRIRRDSTWNVPEPELTLVIHPSAQIIGYTIGNDMSSRSIEGENPLYLPQAKIYDGSAALGPCLLLAPEPLPADTGIRMMVERSGKIRFDGHTTIGQMKRGQGELVEFLYREYSFPNGCYLMTGTCVVPENDFTLESGDVITIGIDHIGSLVNRVA